MIKEFADDEAEKVFHGEQSRVLPADIQNRARRKLRMINAATRLQDLQSPPGNRLHALHGDREGQHAIYVNDQWRVCFRWDAGDVTEVEITDYHD